MRLRNFEVAGGALRQRWGTTANRHRRTERGYRRINYGTEVWLQNAWEEVFEIYE